MLIIMEYHLPFEERLANLQLNRADEDRIRSSSNPDRVLDILSYLTGRLAAADPVSKALDIFDSYEYCDFQNPDEDDKNEQQLSWLIRSWSWHHTDQTKQSIMSPELRKDLIDMYLYMEGCPEYLPPADQPLTRDGLHRAVYNVALEESDGYLQRKEGKQGMPVEWDIDYDGYQHRLNDKIGAIIESRDPVLVLGVLKKTKYEYWNKIVDLINTID